MCGEQKCNYEHRRHFCPERIKHFTQSGFAAHDQGSKSSGWTNQGLLYILCFTFSSETQRGKRIPESHVQKFKGLRTQCIWRGGNHGRQLERVRDNKKIANCSQRFLCCASFHFIIKKICENKIHRREEDLSLSHLLWASWKTFLSSRGKLLFPAESKHMCKLFGFIWESTV